jgi:hypothetical protein
MLLELAEHYHRLVKPASIELCADRLRSLEKETHGSFKLTGHVEEGATLTDLLGAIGHPSSGEGVGLIALPWLEAWRRGQVLHIALELDKAAPKSVGGSMTRENVKAACAKLRLTWNPQNNDSRQMRRYLCAYRLFKKYPVLLRQWLWKGWSEECPSWLKILGPSRASEKDMVQFLEMDPEVSQVRTQHSSVCFVLFSFFFSFFSSL